MDRGSQTRRIILETLAQFLSRPKQTVQTFDIHHDGACGRVFYARRKRAGEIEQRGLRGSGRARIRNMNTGEHRDALLENGIESAGFAGLRRPDACGPAAIREWEQS